MPDVPDPLRAALAARYLLERELGRGGMATVYLAHDVKHHRRVAVKVLRPELAASLGADRFLKEIEIAANLQHPHILPLFDSGSVAERRSGSAEFLYYVMPYVAGESLRGLMNREGTLAPGRVVPLIVQIADALGYAHKHGVVHRDIKPENILLAEGYPIVADFGIAKAVSTAGGVALTRTGFPIGTPGYMSPEQAAGLRELDQRTDVFSLACVCYEMLIGETPGMWLTEDAVKLGRFEDASPAHRARLDRLSGSLELVMVRALAMRLERRTPTVTEFAQALEGALQDRRRFGDTDVRAIMHEAAEAEAKGPEADDALTIGTVQRIGAEAGLPADEVRQAAGRVGRPRTTPREPARVNPLLGSPSQLRYERVVNVEVAESQYPDIVDDIRSAMGDNGLVSTLGRSLTWSSTPRQPGLATHVSLVVQDGRTKILAQENLKSIIGGLFGGIMGGAGGGGLGPIIGGLAEGVHLAPPLVVLVAFGWIATTYGTARTIFRRVGRSHAERLERLVEHLAEQIIAGSPTTARRIRPAPAQTPEQITP